MRILVTGGAGFIGTALIDRALQNDIEVRVLDLADRLDRLDISDDRVTTSIGDFSDLPVDAPCLSDVDAVVHLGCTTHPKSSMDDPAFDVQSNIIGSIRLLQAAVEHGIATFIFASSGGTVYGAPRTIPVTEEAPTYPLSAYGISKLAIEKYVNLYSHTSGLRGVSLRIANAYGPYQLQGTVIGSIAHFLRRVANRQPIEIWGDGKIVRDYVYVSDIIDGIFRCLDPGSSACGTYNLGTGSGHSLNHLLELIFELTGQRTDVNYKPARAFDVEQIVLDHAALSAATGWRPQVDLAEGISRMWRELQRQPERPS